MSPSSLCSDCTVGLFGMALVGRFVGISVLARHASTIRYQETASDREVTGDYFTFLFRFYLCDKHPSIYCINAKQR